MSTRLAFNFAGQANVWGQQPPAPGLSEEQKQGALSEPPPNPDPLREGLGLPQLPCPPSRNHQEKLPHHQPCVPSRSPNRAGPPRDFHSCAQQGEAVFAPSGSRRNVLQMYLGHLPSRFQGCFPGKSGRGIRPSSSTPGGAPVLAPERESKRIQVTLHLTQRPGTLPSLPTARHL